MRWSRQPPIPFITENKKGRPRPRKERIGKRQAMHRCWHPSRKANPESLKDKARGKCLICRQEGHWAKECPNRDKSPKTACYKCHQLGHWVALRPRDPRASRLSTKPSLMIVQQVVISCLTCQLNSQMMPRLWHKVKKN